MGNVNWLMIRSEVILSLSVEGGAGVGSGGEVFKSLHLFSGGQVVVVAKDSRVALYCARVVGGRSTLHCF